MKNPLIISLILLQLVIITAFGLRIYNKQKVLGTISIQPLKTEHLIKNNESRLKYFFEPASDSIASEAAALRWVDDTIRYTINSDTLNETKNYDVIKPDKSYRIITLGDSFTYGLYVNTNENWPSLLENKLNSDGICSGNYSFEVINLGLPGNDIQYSVERYRIRGMKYDPDLIIWLLKQDDYIDINELMREKEEKYTKEMKETGEYEKLLSQGVPNPILNKLIHDMEKTRQELGENALFIMQTGYLEELFTYYQNKLVILHIPFEHSRYQEYFRQLTKRRNGTYYDELPNIFFDPKYTFAPHDTHPNVHGHQMIAEKTYNYLRGNHLIPCN